MYRVPAATSVLLLWAATAHASSVVTLPEAGGETPSIIALGSAEPPTLEGVPVEPEMVQDETNQPRYRVGASILAFGETAIPAAPVAVASIEPESTAEPEEPHLSPMPLVIRGGVIGDAFSAPPADEVELPEEALDDEDGTVPAEPARRPG